MIAGLITRAGTRHCQRCRVARGGAPHTAHAMRLGLAERVQVPPPRIDGARDERARKLHSVPGPPPTVAGGTGAQMSAEEASQLAEVMAWLGYRELAGLVASAAVSAIAGGGR